MKMSRSSLVVVIKKFLPGPVASGISCICRAKTKTNGSAASNVIETNGPAFRLAAGRPDHRSFPGFNRGHLTYRGVRRGSICGPYKLYGSIDESVDGNRFGAVYTCRWPNVNAKRQTVWKNSRGPTRELWKARCQY